MPVVAAVRRYPCVLVLQRLTIVVLPFRWHAMRNQRWEERWSNSLVSLVSASFATTSAGEQISGIFGAAFVCDRGWCVRSFLGFLCVVAPTRVVRSVLLCRVCWWLARALLLSPLFHYFDLVAFCCFVQNLARSWICLWSSQCSNECLALSCPIKSVCMLACFAQCLSIRLPLPTAGQIDFVIVLFCLCCWSLALCCPFVLLCRVCWWLITFRVHYFITFIWLAFLLLVRAKYQAFWSWICLWSSRCSIVHVIAFANCF